MADGRTQEGEPTSPTRHARPIWLAALAAAVIFIAVFGTWWTQVNTRANLDAVTSPGELFQRAQSQDTSLTAVGRLTGLPRPCTGWVLATGGGDDVPAHAVTTARCVGLSDPATILTDRTVPGAALEVNDFAGAAGEVDAIPVPVEQVGWASVRGTDLAVLELGATVGELAERGVRAITPVATPEQGAELLVAGVPVTGVPADQQLLRGSRCQLGPSADVLAGPLLWSDVRAMDCPGILDGSQGSPALNRVGAALAMANASTIGAPEGPDCTAARPCEVTSGGDSVRDNTSYLVSVQALAGCFPDGRLQLGADCDLEDPAAVVPAVAAARVGRPGSSVEVTLAGAGDSPDSVPMVKQGPLGDVDCRAPAGWGAAVQGSSATAAAGMQPEWTHLVTLPTQEGRTLVCVGSATHPTEIVLTVDGTPPDPASIGLTQTVVAGGVQVQPVADPPELVAFRWLIAAPGSADCGAGEGYVEYGGSPETIQAADLPATVCVIGVDEAGNASQPAAIEVT
ncbi:MAG: hypothetical protein WCF36_21755 [Candidatus Nanopelagicales bacterium]